MHVTPVSFEASSVSFFDTVHVTSNATPEALEPLA